MNYQYMNKLNLLYLVMFQDMFQSNHRYYSSVVQYGIFLLIIIWKINWRFLYFFQGRIWNNTTGFLKKNQKTVCIFYQCGVNSLCTFLGTLEKELFFHVYDVLLGETFLRKDCKFYYFIQYNIFIYVSNRKKNPIFMYIFWSLNTRLKMPQFRYNSIQFLIKW